MVTRQRAGRGRLGSLQMDCLVALGLLTTVVLPLAYGFLHSQRLMRQTYQRAVVLELIDGELEVLASGEWRAFPEGTRDYPLHGGALTNVPPGRFVLTRTAQHCRLDWQPADARQHVPFGREVALKGGLP